jgi:hypothetical protein
MLDTIGKSTKTKVLLDLAQANRSNMPLLNKIVTILQDRKNDYAFMALIEVGEILQAVERIEVSKNRDELRGYFKWPSTDAPASKYGFDCEAYFYTNGLLGFVGYKVGNEGESTMVRLKILDCVFHNKLPKVESPEYMSEWGGVETSERLKKMAECIAAFVRNAKRRSDADMSIAIDEWESDLKYLYDKYYSRVSRFSWPK